MRDRKSYSIVMAFGMLWMISLCSKVLFVCKPCVESVLNRSVTNVLYTCGLSMHAQDFIPLREVVNA